MTTTPNSIEAKGQKIVERVENVLDELETLKADYMNACKEKREDIKEIYVEAKNQGLNVKALKGVVKLGALNRKIDKIDADFDEDESRAYDQLCLSMGLLGEAAAKAAGYAPKAEAPKPEGDITKLGRGPVSGDKAAVDALG